MQILMIGNGFDLEHKLPTQYKDFLQFVNAFYNIEASDNKLASIEEMKMESRLEEFLKYIFCSQDNNVKTKISSLLNNNIWVRYFNKNSTYIKENWIDFESEISKVIQLLEKAKTDYDEESLLYSDQLKPSLAYKTFCSIISDKQNSIESIDGKVFSYWKKELIADLNRLIKALEIYLVEYVSNIKITYYNPDIANLHPTHVLSFNYTDTFSKVYSAGSSRISYDFIHGKANKDLEAESNMVLGIDEYLDEKERSANTEFIEFQKYYQRIQKRTQCIFKEWKEEIEEVCKKDKAKKVELYIFGHSLDVTDKDVIREFLVNDNVVTTIFYYDQETYDRNIANLVKVIGREELIKRIYGKSKSIFFKPQTSAQLIDNSEFEIGLDIQKVYHLERYGNVEIKELLEKIDDKIMSKCISYFATQEKVISLYDSLQEWSICAEEQRIKLLEIAKELAKKEIVVIHNSEKWNDYDYRGEKGCPIDTLKFLNEINSYNKELYGVKKDIILPAEEFIRKYEKRTGLKEDVYEDIINIFLAKVGWDKDKDQLLWYGIHRISDNNLDVSTKVLSRILKNNIEKSSFDSIRLKYILECCEESAYYAEERQAFIDSYGDNEY